jgi:hypothetical protein
MRILALGFDSGRDFLAHHIANFSPAHFEGALRWQTRVALEEGERVLVEVRFPELPARMLLNGKAETAGRSDNYWIHFAPEERATLDFLVKVARGEVQPEVVRRYPRYPVALRVEWALAGHPDTRQVAQTVDVSADGAFVHTDQPPMAGTRVDVALTMSSGETLRLPARVARTRPHAALSFPFAAAAISEQQQGMGLAFDPRSAETARLREDLRRCEERGELDLEPTPSPRPSPPSDLHGTAFANRV